MSYCSTSCDATHTHEECAHSYTPQHQFGCRHIHCRPSPITYPPLGAHANVFIRHSTEIKRIAGKGILISSARPNAHAGQGRMRVWASCHHTHMLLTLPSFRIHIARRKVALYNPAAILHTRHKWCSIRILQSDDTTISQATWLGRAYTIRGMPPGSARISSNSGRASALQTYYVLFFLLA